MSIKRVFTAFQIFIFTFIRPSTGTELYAIGDVNSSNQFLIKRPSSSNLKKTDRQTDRQTRLIVSLGVSGIKCQNVFNQIGTPNWGFTRLNV